MLFKIPITDRLEITNPIMGVFLGVNHSGRSPTSLHCNKYVILSLKYICQTSLLPSRIGPLKPGAQGLLELSTSKRLLILLMKATVGPTRPKLGCLMSSDKNSKASAIL